ncbi:MAG: type II toxin-antitoxin system RelE/ParE family toxin [Nitrospinae bacterium]|nr:type II toxin-antitoxin system RelE/ParE family toxin [Nitrospinota bacterium]
MINDKFDVRLLRHFRDWLERLKDKQAKARILRAVARMRLGNLGDTKVIRGGVRECRIDYGPGYRLYYGQEGERLILLICGGTKSRQQGDIERAVALWSAYRKPIE